MSGRGRRRLRALYARLYGQSEGPSAPQRSETQLDQKVGREKHILRTYLNALGRRFREETEHRRDTEEDQPHA